MDAKKCRTCGERHWGPICPSSKSSRGSVKPTPPAEERAAPLRAPPPSKEIMTDVGGMVSLTRPALGGVARAAGAAPGPREAIPSSDAARTPPVLKPKPPKPPSRKASAAASETFKSKLGRPFKKDRDKTLTATKPWVALGMSRSAWYRRQAEKRS